MILFFNLIHFTLRFTNSNAFLWIHKIQDPTVLLIHSCAYISLNLFRIHSFLQKLRTQKKILTSLEQIAIENEWKEYTRSYYREKSHVRIPEYKSQQSQIYDARPLIIFDSYFTCLRSLSLCSCSWKQPCSKCTEHSTDTFVALKLGRCLRTNRSHCDLIVTSFGNKCIEMPSVYVVLLQLTTPGPPATQNFPLLRFFPLVAMMAGRFYTPYDVKGTNLHILTARGMSHILGSNWPTSSGKKKCFARRTSA